MKHLRTSLKPHHKQCHQCGKRLTLLWLALFTSHLLFLTSHFPCLRAQNKQTGIASYYSKKATGRRTANGERLHHDSMTCAHRTFAFGTLLKVKNLSNGSEVVVRVNDRGPFGRGRIIDLSWRAARQLGFLTKGITKVTVERVGRIDATTSRNYTPLTILPTDSNLRSAPLPCPQETLTIDQRETEQLMHRTARQVHIHFLQQKIQELLK